MRFLPIFGVLLAVLLSSCKTPKSIEASRYSHAPEAQSAPVQGGSLGPGDLLEIRVFQEGDLSGTYRISTEGTIDFPLCGKVKMASMSASQASDALTQCLSEGYLRRPQVSVLIREYNSKKVFVFGEVQKPGTFPYENEMSIIQAVTLAGGFTKQASKNGTNVTRVAANGREVKIRVPVEDIGVGREKNFALQPGDIIFVPESIF